jgi:hypothetical protein
MPESRSALRSRRERVATPDAGGEKEGRRLYLSEGVHFRVRMLAYQRGRKISEVAEEVLDRALLETRTSRGLTFGHAGPGHDRYQPKATGITSCSSESALSSRIRSRRPITGYGNDSRQNGPLSSRILHIAPSS